MAEAYKFPHYLPEILPAPLETPLDELKVVYDAALNIVEHLNAGHTFGDNVIAPDPCPDGVGYTLTYYGDLHESQIHVGVSFADREVHLGHRLVQQDETDKTIEIQSARITPYSHEAQAMYSPHHHRYDDELGIADANPTEPYAITIWRRGLKEIGEDAGLPPKKRRWFRKD